MTWSDRILSLRPGEFTMLQDPPPLLVVAAFCQGKVPFPVDMRQLSQNRIRVLRTDSESGVVS